MTTQADAAEAMVGQIARLKSDIRKLEQKITLLPRDPAARAELQARIDSLGQTLRTTSESLSRHWAEARQRQP